MKYRYIIPYFSPQSKGNLRQILLNFMNFLLQKNVTTIPRNDILYAVYALIRIYAKHLFQVKPPHDRNDYSKEKIP